MTNEEKLIAKYESYGLDELLDNLDWYCMYYNQLNENGKLTYKVLKELVNERK